MNDLRIRFTALGGGDTNVRAAYVAVTHVTPTPPTRPRNWFELIQNPSPSDPCPDPNAANPSLPALTDYRYDRLGAGQRVETWARVSRNVGDVSGEPIHSWAKPRHGFHAQVLVVLYNGCGDVIHHWTAPSRCCVHRSDC